jgi:hypothetical protein
MLRIGMRLPPVAPRERTGSRSTSRPRVKQERRDRLHDVALTPLHRHHRHTQLQGQASIQHHVRRPRPIAPALLLQKGRRVLFTLALVRRPRRRNHVDTAVVQVLARHQPKADQICRGKGRATDTLR